MTKSVMTRMPRSRAAASNAFTSSTVPRLGWTLVYSATS